MSARIAQQEQDKADPNAHFRHALEVADEQVEECRKSRPATPCNICSRPQIFLSRDEAEEARAERVGVVARRFYAELPAALTGAAARSARGRDVGAGERAVTAHGHRAHVSETAASKPLRPSSAAAVFRHRRRHGA